MNDCLANTGMGSDSVLPLVFAALALVGAGILLYALVKRKAALGALALLPLLFALGFAGPSVAPAAAADPCAPAATPTNTLGNVVFEESSWFFEFNEGSEFVWELDESSDDVALNALLDATTGLPATLTLTVNYTPRADGGGPGVPTSMTFDMPYTVTESPFSVALNGDAIYDAVRAESPSFWSLDEFTAVITVPYNNGVSDTTATITITAPVIQPV